MSDEPEPWETEQVGWFTYRTEEDSDDDGHSWQHHVIACDGDDPAYFMRPPGVDGRTFAGRVRAAIDVLNGKTERDLALVYKLATVDDAAADDHFGGMCWSVLGHHESERDGLHARLLSRVLTATGIDCDQGAPMFWERIDYAAQEGIVEIARLREEVATLRGILASVPPPEDDQ